jgi:iron complex transport system ATP-binding protein
MDVEIEPGIKSLLSVKDLTVGYNLSRKESKPLLQGVNLELREGELACLIGPNGCGKSTLIRTLCGLQKPIAGEIHINGKNINQLEEDSISEFISVVLTDKGTVENITVDEIVSLGRYRCSDWLGRLSSSEYTYVEHAIGLVGLKGFEDRIYGSLSDGEKQRAFIAKAIASDASVMLLDEPTAHLDIPNRVQIMSILRELSRTQGHTILVSTHDLDLAMQLADEIWLIDHECSLFKGTPEELIYSANLDRVFGSELLHFNPQSGSFCVSTKSKGKVFIEGEGKKFEMTVHAAQRLGYTLSEKQNSSLHIQIFNNQWFINRGDENLNFSDLASVCRHIQALN